MSDASDPTPRPTESSALARDEGPMWNAERNAQLEAVFNLAMECPPEERSAYIEKSCDGDPEMGERVRRLVDAHHCAGTVFESLSDPELEAEFARLKPEEAGDRIGAYQLLEQIGEGGFGTVWMAEQEQPVKRKVALKIIKLGMDTKNVIARFEQERQALALMAHPNIAKVFDAGATQYGRPYFAMELVQGIKITEYCDKAGIDVPGRLELFMDVCRAVQHAHQKGIIHRDLKPSNILVALQDGKPVPKVIDFGVAKAVEQRLTELTIFTEMEQLIGTPLYMSPEQAESGGINVDTRTDIYALGVVLYELLTGRTPFDRASLLAAGYDEMRRMIREVQPAAPSTALLTTTKVESEKIASCRQSETRKLVHLVRGDLDCIVMKSLEKERSRRYETANALLLDIERSTRGEPIRARPPSRVYRLKRMVRRNRLAFSAAAIVLTALVTTLVLTMRSGHREAAQRKLADERSAEAIASARRAEQLLYAADMNQVQDALRMNDLRRARSLLDDHRPKAGEDDLRDWEWRYLWQLCRSKAKDTLITNADSVLSVTFSANSKLIAGCFGDGSIRIWDVETKRLTQEIGTGLRLPTGRAGTALLKFSPANDTLVLATATGVNIYDLNIGGKHVSVDLDGAVSGFAFSHDGRYLICRMPNEGGGKSLPLDYPKLAIVDLPTRSRIANEDTPDWMFAHSYGDIRFSGDHVFAATRDGRQLGIAGFDRRRRISHRFLPAGEDDHLLAMDLSIDGKAAVVGTGWQKSEIQVWDMDSTRIKATLNRHTAYISDLVFSPTGNILASASGDQTVRIWDTQTWLEIGVLRGHGAEVSTIAFSANGNLLASGSKDGEILLWDSIGMTQTLPRVDFPADVQRVVPFFGRSSVKVYRPGGASVWSLPDFIETSDAEESNTLADTAVSRRRSRSRDGRWTADLVAGLVRLKDTVENRELDLKGHLLEANGAAFSPNSRRLATTSGGAEAAKIWDMRTGREVLNLPGRGMNLRYVFWTDDESVLIVNSSTPGYSQAWIAPTWEQIESQEKAFGRWPIAQAQAAVATAMPESKRKRTDKPVRDPTGENIDLEEKSLEDLMAELDSRFIVSGTNGSALNTDDARLAHVVGAWQIWVGRDRDDSALSARALKLVPLIQGAGVPSRLIRLYCLRPASDPVSAGEAISFARRAVSRAKGSGVPWHQLTLGMALYRNEEFNESLNILSEAERGAQNVHDQGGVVAISRLVQAMCQFRLNDREAARVYLQRGAEKMRENRPLPVDNDKPFADGATVNDLETWIIYREARALVEAEAESPAK